MSKITRLFFIIIVLCSFSSTLNAENEKIGLPEIKYYKRSDYGGDRQNWRITQNQYGLLFFANNDGLLSFDGANWKLNPQNNVFTSTRSVKNINGQLFVGSYNELGYYDYDSHQQLNYHSLSNQSALKSCGDYWDIVPFNKGVAFYSERAVCIFNSDILDSILIAPIRFLGIYSVNDKLLIQDISKGLMEFKEHQLVTVEGGSVFINKDIGTIIPLSKDELIIGTLKDGLFIWDLKGIRPWNVSANAMLKKADVLCGSLYLNDYLLFGTIQMGLIITDKQGNVISQLGKDKGLGNNTVLTVFIDKEENIWCGLDNGIAKINYNSSVSFLNSYYDLGTGFAMEHFNGSYYLATIQALYKIDDQKFNSQLKEKEDFIKIEGTEGQCWSLFKDKETLLCGHTFGVFSIEKDKSNLITPPSVNGVWIFRHIANQPNLLIAGTYDGLIILEKINDQWRFKCKIANFYESARFIEWESDYTLLISHSDNGVYRLKLSSDYSKVISMELFNFDDFPNNKTSLALSIVESKCLFTNQNGIFIIPEESRKPQRFNKFDGFFADKQFPTNIKEDQHGNIWCYYANRIGVLKKLEDGSLRNIYFPFEPLKNKLVNHFETSFDFDNNSTFFTTDEGFAHYWSNNTKNYQKAFSVNITSFRNKTDSATYSYLQNESETKSQNEIPHFKFRNNSFEVQYAAAFFDDEKIEYSTFLKNIDTSPTAWSSINIRSFSDLPEGKYEFSVVAKNKYQVQSIPVIFRFVVNPPWYQSIIAKLVYILLGCIFLYILNLGLRRYVKMMQNRASAENEMLFIAKEERLRNETLLKEKELTRLNNARLLAEVLFKEKELATLTLHIVRKNDFLSDFKEQLIRITKSNDKTDNARKINNLIQKINQDIENENNWQGIEQQFEQVHQSFLTRLQEKHPIISPREKKLCAYIRMGMASRDIASLTNISTRAVENNRYKLRQTLDLAPNDNLAEYIMNL